MSFEEFLKPQSLDFLKQGYPQLIPIAEDCYNQSLKQVPEGWCSPRFLKAWCWHAVSPNTSLSQACDLNVNFKQGVSVSRSCDSNGEWTELENYESCSDDISSMIKLQTMCYTLSLISLIVAIGVYFVLRLWTTQHGLDSKTSSRNLVHMHLFVSFTFPAIMYLVNKYLHENKVVKGCNVLFVLQLYALTSNIFWLVVEGILLHFLVRSITFSPKPWITHFCVFGWGCPLLVIVIFSSLKALMCGNDRCWRYASVCSNSDFLIWIPRSTWIISVMYNAFVFGVVLWTVVSKLIAARSEFPAAKGIKTLRATIVLIPLFGIHYLFLSFLPPLKPEDSNSLLFKIRHFYDSFFTSTQGLFVSILYCYLYPLVWDVIKKILKKRQRRFLMNNTTASVTALQKTSVTTNLNPSAGVSKSNSHSATNI